MFPVWYTPKHLVYPDCRIVSYMRKDPKIVSVGATREGYQRVRITKTKNYETYYLHHVMANCFIGIRPKGLDINHIDGNKLNNVAGNLEYITRKENIRHAWNTGLAKAKIGEDRHNSRFTNEEILIMHRLNGLGLSQAEIGVIFKTHQRCVSAILKGTNWPHIKEIYEKHHRGITEITKRNKECLEGCKQSAS